MADSLLLVRCNHCGGAIREGEACDCRYSGPPLDALDRAQRALRRMVESRPNPDLLTEAAALADELEQADTEWTRWAAGVVRRLAGLPCPSPGACEVTPVEPCPACEEMERGPVS